MLFDLDTSTEPLQIGRYLIYEEIARGRAGAVHFGRLTGVRGFQRTVAVKRFSEFLVRQVRFRASLMEEANRAGRIQHSNVVQLLDVVSEGSELLLVSEYVHGETLHALEGVVRSAGQQIELAIVSAIALGILHGLHAAHEVRDDSEQPLRIVHGSLGSSRVMIGQEGGVHLLGFGSDRVLDDLESGGDAESGLRLIGGLAAVSQRKAKRAGYRAPEQGLGFPRTEVDGAQGLEDGSHSVWQPHHRDGLALADRRADVYAAGVILWELLTGRSAGDWVVPGVGGRQVADQSAMHIFPSLPPPSSLRPELPPELDELVATAIVGDPEQRYPTARDFAWALGEIIHPASPEQIAAWVSSWVGDLLTERAWALAEISRHSAETRGEGILQPGSPSSGRVRVTGSGESCSGLPIAAAVVPPRLPSHVAAPAPSAMYQGNSGVQDAPAADVRRVKRERKSWFALAKLGPLGLLGTAAAGILWAQTAPGIGGRADMERPARPHAGTVDTDTVGTSQAMTASAQSLQVMRKAAESSTAFARSAQIDRSPPAATAGSSFATGDSEHSRGSNLPHASQRVTGPRSRRSAR